MKYLRQNKKNTHEERKNSRGKKNYQLNRAKRQSWYLDYQFEKAMQKEL